MAEKKAAKEKSEANSDKENTEVETKNLLGDEDDEDVIF